MPKITAAIKQTSLFFFFFAGASSGAFSQESWESRMDLVSAGAAASVVLHHACGKSTSEATQSAANRISVLSTETSNPQDAYQYATRAYETKVRALWQSSGGDCDSPRLRNIAQHTGFSIPK